jgi:MULE transposase domain
MLGNGYHNHPRSFGAVYPVHRRQARTKQPEIHNRILADARVSTITAKETHMAVQQQFPEVEINLKDISNIQTKRQTENDIDLPAIQAMIRDLGDAFHFHYSLDEYQRLVNLIFIEKASLDLLRRWPYTIILDATYKTNKFGMYLVDIVGVSSAGRTFIIAQAFLSAEGEEDYSFILEWLRSVYVQAGLDMPISITSDRALGLLVALKAIFPTSYHLLCTVHVNRDVLTWCKKHWQDELLSNVDGYLSIDSDNNQASQVHPSTLQNSLLISTEERAAYLTSRTEDFLRTWNAVINATTLTGEKGYEKAWSNLRLAYLGHYPQIVSYLEITWLPYKKSFCKAWTNLVRHFGNTTSNRAEGSHRGVKKKLPQHRLHIRKVVDIMKVYLKTANRDHLKDIEQDRTSVGRYFI